MRTTPRWALDRATTFGLGVAMVLGVLVTAANLHQLRDATETTAWVMHTHEVREQTDALMRDILDAETGQRGFLLTGDPAYLTPWERGRAGLATELARLRELVRDNPAQIGRVDRLGELVRERLRELAENLDIRRQQGLAAVVPHVRSDVGQRVMNDVRSAVDEMQREEAGLLRERLAAAAASRTRLELWLVAAAAFAIGLVGIVLFGLNAATRRRLVAERELADSEERLHVTLRSIGDAVIATDERGHIVFMNPIAEACTGWSEREARGRHLDEVFLIVNEDTRATVESPVAKVLREGTIVGLANHTLLVRRDGTDVPIDDSGAPVREADGDIMGVVLVFRDVSERREYERVREHAAGERRWRELAESLPQMVWTCRSDGHCDYLSPQWRTYTGVQLAQQLGYGWLEAVHPDDRAPTMTRWRAAVATTTPFRVEHRLRRHDGTYRWMDARATPLGARDGETRWFGTSTDVTELKEAEADREGLLRDADRARADAEEARALAESANVAKDQFLAVLSHELRAPLNAMMAWLGLLKRGALQGTDLTRAVATIERNVNLQAQLIDDLLDVSRIVSGKLSLDAQRVDLGAVVQTAVEDARQAAAAKGVALEADVAVLDHAVLGDAQRLRQVVTNLLTNAIKFTPPGGRVTVALGERAGAAGIEVSDTGAGIAPDFLPHVFDRFRQADETSTRAHGGLGLGLSIVRHLVELHGGTVGVASDGPGRGACFRVRLPMDSAPFTRVPALLPTLPASQSPDVLDGVHVLLVEDDDDTREALSAVLEAHGATVRATASVTEALARLDDALPDVVLSDIAMPGRSGLDLIRELRATHGPALPVLALTGHASSNDRREALDAGFDDHLAKPIAPEVLLARLRAVVRRSAP
ncbi:MAG: CHASE3 domain-containing protein [bacterium]|nr:CHASE3 domain-containing protein [bacterium]